MKKAYVVEFKYVAGNVERVTFHTEDVLRSISEYGRNKAVVDARILEENQLNTSKQILLG